MRWFMELKVYWLLKVIFWVSYTAPYVVTYLASDRTYTRTF